MDQGVSAIVRSDTGTWTWGRLLLLSLGAVFLGVALSLLLGSSPAHAAESDDPGSGDGLLGGVSTVVDQTLEQTTSAVSPIVTPVVAPLVHNVEQALPAPVSTAPVAKAVDQLTGGIASASPVLQPVLTPVLQPVTSIADTTLGSIDRLITPVATAGTPVETSAPAAPFLAAAPIAIRTATSLVPATVDVIVAQTEGASLPLPTVVPVAPADSGTVPAASFSASPIAPLGMLASLLVTLAIAALGIRRRATDDDLPASPVFETDTSPA